jgi:hypothetical protein
MTALLTASVPLSDQAFVALDGLSRRPRFTGPHDLVFCTRWGTTCRATPSVMASTRR